MNFVGNILKSITYLILASQNASGPSQKYFVMKQMYEVSSYMNEMNSGGDDPSNVLELPKAVQINENFESLLKVFEKALIKNVKFFQELCAEKIEQKNVLVMIDEMHGINSQVSKIFQAINAETNHHLGTLIVYGLFQKIILNEIESNTTLIQAEELRTHVLHKNLATKALEKLDDILVTDAALATVSAHKMKYGKIVYANKSLCNNFGYLLSEILNENIIHIIPNIVGANHEKYMKEYENRGGGTFFKRIRQLF